MKEWESYREYKQRYWRPKVSIMRLLTLGCLLLLPLWYYTQYFQVRYFEDPLSGLTYAKHSTPEQLRRFSEEAVSELILPLEEVADEIQQVRKATKGNPVSCIDRQNLEPLRERLEELYCRARERRRIPEVYAKRYQDLILATQDLSYSVNWVYDIYSAESVSSRKKAYKKSLKEWKEARKRLQRARDYFEKASAPNYRPSAG